MKENLQLYNMRKSILTYLLLLIGLGTFAQTSPSYPSIPPGFAPYGSQYYKNAAGTVIIGTSAGAFRVVTNKYSLDSLAAAVDGKLATKVPNTRTVNGKALSTDITITKSDVGLGNVDNISSSGYNLQLVTTNGSSTNRRIVSSVAIQSDSSVFFTAKSTGKIQLGDNVRYIVDTIYNYGNSITAGFGVTQQVAYAPVFSEIVGAFNINRGISGTKMQRSAASPADSAMYSRISGIPEKKSGRRYLMFAYGTNDINNSPAIYNITDYTTDYNAVLDAAIAKGWSSSDIIIIGPNYVHTGEGTSAGSLSRGASYNSVTQSIATSRGITFVNVRDAFIAAGPRTVMMSDSIHPNNQGHQLYVKLLMSAINPYIAPSIVNFGKSYLYNTTFIGNRGFGGVNNPTSISFDGTFANSSNDVSQSKLLLINSGASRAGFSVNGAGVSYFSEVGSNQHRFYGLGGVNIMNGNIQVNSLNTTQSATPPYIDLGSSSFASAANTPASSKIRLFGSGSNISGIGVSSAGIEYFSSVGGGTGVHYFRGGTINIDGSMNVGRSVTSSSASLPFINLGDASFSSTANTPANAKIRLFANTGFGVSSAGLEYFSQVNGATHRFRGNSVIIDGDMNVGENGGTPVLRVGNTITGLVSVTPKISISPTSYASSADATNSLKVELFTNTGIGVSTDGLQYRSLGTSDKNHHFRDGKMIIDYTLQVKNKSNGLQTDSLVTSNPTTGELRKIANNYSISSNYTASGNGSATTIVIPHGLTGVSSTSAVQVGARNAASAGISYWTSDATNINIVYTVAPASGTNNLSYTISIKP